MSTSTSQVLVIVLELQLGVGDAVTLPGPRGGLHEGKYEPETHLKEKR